MRCGNQIPIFKYGNSLTLHQYGESEVLWRWSSLQRQSGYYTNGVQHCCTPFLVICILSQILFILKIVIVGIGADLLALLRLDELHIGEGSAACQRQQQNDDQ